MSADGTPPQDFRAGALLKLFEQEQSGPGPKRAQLCRAMVKMISQAFWNAGQRLPTDKEFTRQLPVSVATVQGALNMLAEQGLVTRKKRDGTFVAPEEHLSRETAFFNFSNADGTAMARVQDLKNVIEETRADGPWTSFLVPATTFVRIVRIVEVDRAFRVLGHFYLPMPMFHELLTMPADTLTDVSVRSYLHLHFGKPTTCMNWAIAFEDFDLATVDALDLPRACTGQRFDVKLWTTGKTPLGFHRIWVPPNNRSMNVVTQN